jgi:hypothetical protein
VHVVIVSRPARLFSKLNQEIIAHSEYALQLVTVTPLYEYPRCDRAHPFASDILSYPRADFLGLAHQHTFNIKEASLRVDPRCLIGPEPQEFVRGRLARNHRPDAAIFGGDLECHLTAMAHPHVANPIRRNERQHLHVLSD